MSDTNWKKDVNFVETTGYEDFKDREKERRDAQDAQREEYFQMFFLGYLYYNIVNNCSRKIEIIELSQFFDKIYKEFSDNATVIKEDNDFSKYAIHNAVDNCEEIKMLIEKVMKQDKYSKMFHISDEAVIIDDDFSFSPVDEFGKLNQWFCGLYNLKALFYMPRKFESWGYGTDCHNFFVKNASSGEMGSVMQGICEKAIKDFEKPVMSPESEKVIISPENKKLGKYLAYRFIYRCGKAWFRKNEGKLGEELRTPWVIIEGISGASGTKLDEMIKCYIKDINSKYLELANRFAFLLQIGKAASIVFDTHYNGKDAFYIGARKYIIDFVNSDFQRFKVWKDFNGDVYFQDSVIAQLNISNMTDTAMYYFKYKDYLDKMALADELFKKYMRSCTDCQSVSGLEVPSFDISEKPVRYVMKKKSLM